MFTTAPTTPHDAGGVLPLSNRKASTASELLALFGARQTPGSVTKSKSRTSSATPVSSFVKDLARPDDYPLDSASPYLTPPPHTTTFFPSSTDGSLDQHDVLFSHEESPTLFVPTASCSYGMDQEQQRQHESQQQGNSALQTKLEQSDVLRNNSIYPDCSCEEPFRYCDIVRAVPEVGQLSHSSPSKAKPFDHPSSDNGELKHEDFRVTLPPDPVLETPSGLVGSRTSTTEDCIEQPLIIPSFQAKSSQPHTSNLIRLSSPLLTDELSTNENPKSDVSKPTTARPTPSRRNSARKRARTNTPKSCPTSKKNIISTVTKNANRRTNSESPRPFFAPARRYGIRKPSASKSKPAILKQPSSQCGVGMDTKKTNEAIITLSDPIDP
jgi:hypothetical protein